MAQRALILGAAGRDFHNFNTFFRGNDDYQVVAFTATQIPDIEGRRYPPELAGAAGNDDAGGAKIDHLVHDLKVSIFVDISLLGKGGDYNNIVSS